MRPTNTRTQDPTRLNHIRINLTKKPSLGSPLANDPSPELRQQTTLQDKTVPQSILYDHHLETPEKMPFAHDPSKKWDFQAAVKDSEERLMKIEIEKRMHAVNLDQDGRKVSVIHFIEENNQEERKHKQVKSSGLKLPKRQAIITAILLIVGILLLIAGIVISTKSDHPNRAIAFWITGGICALPGFYFALRFCQGFYAHSVEAKRRVLQDIPRDV